MKHGPTVRDPGTSIGLDQPIGRTMIIGIGDR